MRDATERFGAVDVEHEITHLTVPRRFGAVGALYRLEIDTPGDGQTASCR